MRSDNIDKIDGTNIHSVAVNTTPHQTIRKVIVFQNDREFAPDFSQFRWSRSRTQALLINSSKTK